MKPDLDGGGFTQLLSVALGKIGSGFGNSCGNGNNPYQYMIIIDEETSKYVALNQYFSHDSEQKSVQSSTTASRSK